MPEQPSRTIEITRVVDAPRDLVWAACTEAEHLQHWWGPEGFGVASAESDPREGGAFTIVMRSPDGHDSQVHGTYREFRPPERLVTDSTAAGPDGAPFIESTTTIELTDLDGKTEIRVRASAFGLADGSDVALAGMELGWVQTLRRLDDHLTGAAERQIVLMRLLEAKPAEVFEVWTTPEHVAAWWGPQGFTLTTESMEVRPGGTWRFVMHGPDGVDHPNVIEFDEVVPPERLTFLHLGEPDDPAFRAVVTFDEYLGSTLLTMRSVFETAGDRDLVVDRYGAIEGGNQTLDRLVAYVAERA
jgi:uncharacterized protein YndB with AHSA1/START domain